MNKTRTNGLLLLGLVFGMLVAALLSLRAGLFTKQEQVGLGAEEGETLLLPELEWGSYTQLSKKVKRWGQSFSWTMPKPGSEKRLPFEKTNNPSPSISQARAVYQAELAERQALFTEAAKRREEQMELEIEGKVEQRRNQGRYAIKEAVAGKKREQAEVLTDFQGKKEEDYSLKLVSLHFKAKIPDLSPEEKLLLTEEISALEQELAAEIEAKRQELERELQSFAAHHKQVAEDELEAYRQSLQVEGKKRYLHEKEQLEQEFFEWKEKRLSELGLPAETTG